MSKIFLTPLTKISELWKQPAVRTVARPSSKGMLKHPDDHGHALGSETCRSEPDGQMEERVMQDWQQPKVSALQHILSFCVGSCQSHMQEAFFHLTGDSAFASGKI